MRRSWLLLGSALSVALLAGVAGGQQAPPRPPSGDVGAQPEEQGRAGTRPVPGTPTRLGQELLERSDLLAVTRVRSVSEGGFGVALVRLDLLSVLASRTEHRYGQQVVVLAYPGTFAAGDDQLVFLRAMGEVDRFEVLHRVSTSGARYAERLAVCRRTAELARIVDDRRRARATLDWLLPPLDSSDAWWARYALDELEYMAERQPWVFDQGSAARLHRAAERAPDAAIALGVKNVAKRVENQPQRLREREEKAPSPP